MDGGAVTNTIGGGQIATFDPLLGQESKNINKKKRLRDIIPPKDTKNGKQRNNFVS